MYSAAIRNTMDELCLRKQWASLTEILLLLREICRAAFPQQSRGNYGHEHGDGCHSASSVGLECSYVSQDDDPVEIIFQC
ncbi:hypothetical protein U27_03119 [Candidatus Vecturithrix granuli]|uniref:Uncharacterized protein n=1 Tax=Vecturithrix granuli TaxID=1499967 RepID=A0A081BV02_VECG1|nr:hypothetical protein U27_03119 [Candidatus Vecturithrix granuli]